MRLLFITAKTLEQLKYPSRGNWIGQMWRVHAKEYYLAIKKEKSIEIHRNMGRPRKHDANAKEPDIRDHTLYDSIYRKHPDKGRIWRQGGD